LFPGQFSLVITLPVVLRGVIADGEARPLGVVILDISFNRLFKVCLFPAWFYLNDKNSILVDPDDVGAIAEAIKTLKDNVELRKSMSEYSLSRHEEYSITGRAKRILSFIDRCCTRKSRHGKIISLHVVFESRHT
jgi:hypothetical protein